MVVKILFNILDSFAPTDSKIDNKITTTNEKKSGYGAKKLMFIGNNSRKYVLIRFSNNSSKYTLKPRATLEVPISTENFSLIHLFFRKQ